MIRGGVFIESLKRQVGFLIIQNMQTQQLVDVQTRKKVRAGGSGLWAGFLVTMTKNFNISL